MQSIRNQIYDLMPVGRPVNTAALTRCLPEFTVRQVGNALQQMSLVGVVVRVGKGVWRRPDSEKKPVFKNVRSSEHHHKCADKVVRKEEMELPGECEDKTEEYKSKHTSNIRSFDGAVDWLIDAADNLQSVAMNMKPVSSEKDTKEIDRLLQENIKLKEIVKKITGI